MEPVMTDDADRNIGVPVLYSEGNVATRVALEREVRGWSTTELAQRITRAGVPLNQSAIWRIENGDPRRRINLDEALGFSRVFELPLEELMSPALEGLGIEERRLIQEAVEAFYERQEATDRLHHATVALSEHITSHPDASRGIHEQFLRLMSAEREARALAEYVREGGVY